VVANSVPITSPNNGPVKLVAVAADVAEVADVAVVALPKRLPVTFPTTFPVTFPVSAAVIVPALKFPDASRFTMAFTVSAFVAALARTAPAAIVAAVCPPTRLTVVANSVPITSPTNDPVKLVAVVADVADVAEVALVALPKRLPVTFPVTFPVKLPVTLPVSAAVIVFALKLPDPSRFTMAFTVSAFVAALASNAPEAIFAAVWPPTALTTVANSVPVTSPSNDEVK